MDEPDNPTSEQIATFRPLLLRLAMFQLRDAALAEDVAQEALAAAIEKQASFEGRSSLRTWVISILRFKILDAMRNRRRLDLSVEPAALTKELDDSVVTGCFDGAGRWKTQHREWSDPSAQLHQDDFLRVLESCMTHLPPNMSRAFMMREWLELTTGEICARMDVSPGNLRVLLYRSRMQLRTCVDRKWGRD